MHAGAGFKPQHFCDIIAATQPIGFLEVHAENYMGAGGPPHAQLGALRERYALSIHGVGLSIGSMQPLDRDHLARLKVLCDRYQPESFSEHLAWSSHDGVYFNDLLPMPYTANTLARVVEHIDEVQTALRRTMLLENPSGYVRLVESTMAEVDFLTEVSRRTGCGLLLDVNNVFVSAKNNDAAPLSYLVVSARSGERNPPRWPSRGNRRYWRAALDRRPRNARRRRSLDTLCARRHPRRSASDSDRMDNDVPDWPTLRDQTLKAETILTAASRASAA